MFHRPGLATNNTKSPRMQHPKQIQSIQAGAKQRPENNGTCGKLVCGVQRRQVEATKAMQKLAVHRCNRFVTSESLGPTREVLLTSTISPSMKVKENVMHESTGFRVERNYPVNSLPRRSRQSNSTTPQYRNTVLSVLYSQWGTSVPAA